MRLAALLPLVLLTVIGGSLATWSARARSPELTEATLTGDHKGPARPASSPLDEALDAPDTEPAASSSESVAVTAQPETRQAAFTITWERTETSSDGQQSRLLRATTRYQRADGVYKLVQTHPAREGDAGLVATYYGYVGLGLFRLDEARRRLVFIAPQSDEQPEDVEAFLRADPRFNRVEDVRGQLVIVLRTDEADAAAYAEEYRAPALGGLLIKSVEHSPRGREVWEPTSIELGEPSASFFADLNRYAPDYARYEREMLKVERDPQQRGAARVMRDLLRRVRNVRPDKR
jgi:hypothetical protein